MSRWSAACWEEACRGGSFMQYTPYIVLFFV